MSDSPPNVLLLMGDEHAPALSSPWGGRGQMPHLEQLAAEGAAFDNAYCNSPLCVPSRAALLTGQRASDIGAFDLGVRLSSDLPTVAHALRASGYDAVLAGKQHFLGPDELHGFRAQLAHDPHRHESVVPAWPDDEPGPIWKLPCEAGPGRSEYVDADDAIEAATVDYLRSARTAGRPWFLCSSFIAPHWPYVVPQEYWDRYPLEEIEVPRPSKEELDSQHPVIQRLRRRLGVDRYDEETAVRARAAYYGALTHLDDRIGRVLDVLEETGQAENTLVIYTSDHGGMLGEHGLWRKMNFYEESVRVPLIARWPGAVAAGARSAVPVSLVDIAPTITAAAQASPLPEPAGADLAELLTSPPAQRTVFAEYLAHGVAAPVAMLRRGRWKLVYYHGAAPSLFDLETDPGELRDLAGEPDHQPVLRELLHDLLEDWDPVAVQEDVLRSQARRRLIAGAEQADETEVRSSMGG